jgi:hypothetical protein
MKLFMRITISLIAIFIFGLIFSILDASVILEITNNSHENIKYVSVNYGRGSYLLSEIKSGETVENKIGKIGEGATFEITWKCGENNLGSVAYSVYFSNSSPRISIIFPDETSALLEYRGKVYKPIIKPGS